MQNNTRIEWRRKFLGAIAIIMALACTPAFAQQQLTGYWVFRTSNGDGTVRSRYIELQQTGDTLTGTLLGVGPNGVRLEGTRKGDQIHLQGMPGAGPAMSSAGQPRYKIVFDGDYANGRLNLRTHDFHGNPVEGTAERTTREATLPPPRLPLPVLRDLPDNGLARTPPMGWNSWNKFAGKIDDATVRAIADAMVSSGMAKFGYVYINIDDTWQRDRDVNGNIVPNKKFPDMKALADYVHSKGLKLGIYSSPGPQTCAGYEGSFGHEAQDARQYAAWGVDYLKHDLCSARRIYSSEPDELQALYQKMGTALQASGRPIVYSLCEYGEGDPWKWGAKAGGNLWRTTGDIRDNWASMEQIGFSQIAISRYTGPGRWNDPDMLEVGNGGMTPDEYRTHMSLWSMLAAPLLAGNDLRSMSDVTKSILMNVDVIAIDQDTDANPVMALSQEGSLTILTRKLHGKAVAVGLYNRSEQPAAMGFAWNSIREILGGSQALTARDLWLHGPVTVQGDRFSATVPAHGVVLLRVAGNS